MAARQVTATVKDPGGEILALCQPGAPWSPRQRADAVRDIATGEHTYFVRWSDGMWTAVVLVDGPGGKRLHTDWDRSPRNNLHDLPDG